MALWDWPNQQVVRADQSGPGMDTPPGIPSDAQITYGHSGLNYEFLVTTIAGEPVTGAIDWDFGDGATADDVAAGTPATHTYAAPGHVTVEAHVAGRVRLLQLEVTE